MTEIKIYGASDDLVEVSGCKGADEFSCPRHGPWAGDLVAPNGESLRLHVIYDGCWHVAVGQVDEDVPFPSWPLTFTQAPAMGSGPSYSVLLTVDTPDNTRLTNVRAAETGD